MSRSTLVRLTLVAVSALALTGPSAPAAAAEFPIKTCTADPGGFSTQAFEDFATRGMMWKRACNPEGPGLRGLVTANVVRPGRVARGARSYFVLRAPEGTRFGSLTWSGQARRRDCRYALQIWAGRPDGPPVPIRNVLANRGCPVTENPQVAGWPRAHTYDINGATKIVQRIVCVGAPGEPHCSSRSLNYIRTFTAAATVVDVSPPGVSISQDNAFTRGEWVRGEQSVNYGALDNVGVKLARAMVGGLPSGQHLRACNYVERVPCANGAGAITVDTTRVAEGTQALTVDAVDAADNIGTSGPTTIRVDNTAPGATSVSVDGGEGWRNQNDFDLAWANPDEGDRAPIARAHYRLCTAAGSDCANGSQAAAGIQRLENLAVPRAGEWHTRVWREDAATNQQPANASVPVTLRFDPEPPQLGFEPPASTDPTRMSVLVSDRVSGLAGGQIELSRQGSGIWQTLETEQQGDRLLARIDDAALPAGLYLLRASARDQASNLNTSDRLLDGSPMAIALPLRIPTALTAGVRTKRATGRKTGRPGKRRRARRRVITFIPRARVAFGRPIAVGGLLEDRDGQAIAGAEIHVYSHSAGMADRHVGVVRTNTRGRYRYATKATSTQSLRFVYAGTPLMLPTERSVGLRVAAASTIRAQPRTLRNGRTVHFAGSVRSKPVPAGGKLVELQVVLSGRWQTFRTTRTDADGNWAIKYRFRRSCGVTNYRFRARLPAEAAYPFETGRTRRVDVRVRGRACP